MTSHTESDQQTARSALPTVQALAAAGHQPGWLVLDTARTQEFTGEIEFRTQPAITVYFDHGFAYHAVRAGDPSLCERLVDAGVVEPAQIERGVIRVGNVENLGRLFDRDPSIDRDAVMVVLELATDDVVSTIANGEACTFSLTAYRHHVSGVHRWFVAPEDSVGRGPAQLTPVGEVAQLDSSITRDLPVLQGAADNQPASLDGQPDDDVYIEWDQVLPPLDASAPAPVHELEEDLLVLLTGMSDEPSDGAPADALERSPQADAAAADASEPTDDDDVDRTADVSVPEFAAPVEPIPSPSDNGTGIDAGADAEPDRDDLFQIVWPDGSEQTLADLDIPPATPEAAPVTETTPAPPAEMPSGTHATDAADSAAPIVINGHAMPDVPAHTVDRDLPIDDLAIQSHPGPLVDSTTPAAPAEPREEAAPVEGLSFDMPSLALTADNVPQQQQPEEVVDAVRRALDAIEAALSNPAHLPAVDVGELPRFTPTKPQQTEVVDPLSHDADDVVTDEAASTSTSTITTPPSSLDAVPAPEPSATESASTDAAATGFGGFAPPTMNDSAEAVYARAAAQAADQTAAPASGVASVVFVDDEPNPDDERSGALRRLIGSLRRK